MAIADTTLTEVMGHPLHPWCADDLCIFLRIDARDHMTKSDHPTLAGDGTAVRRLENGGHLAFTYSGHAELGKSALYNFLKRGEDLGQLNLLLIGSEEAERYSAYLRESGMPDLDALAASDEVVVELNDDLVEHPEAILDSLPSTMNRVSRLARARGKTGINALGTIAWNLVRRGRHDDCIILERYWRETVMASARSGVPVTLICPYGSIPAEVRMPLGESHMSPIITIGVREPR